MTRKISLTVGVLLLASVVCSAADPPKPSGRKVQLRRLYAPGNYVLTQQVDMDQVIGIEGQKQKQQTSQTVAMALSVEKPDQAGDRKMTITYRRFKMRMAMAGQVMSYDSDQPDAAGSSPLGMIWGPMLKVKIVVLVGADGQIKKVSGLDELWGEIAKKNPAAGAMLGQMKGQFGDAMLKGLLTKSYELLPKYAVGLGDSWPFSVKLKAPFVGAMKIDGKCKVKSIEKTPAGRIASIDIIGVVRSEEPTASTMGGMTIKINKIHFDQEGNMRYNADTGVPVNQTMRQRGSLAISMIGPDGQEKAMNLQQDMKTLTTVATETKKPAAKPTSPR